MLFLKDGMFLHKLNYDKTCEGDDQPPVKEVKKKLKLKAIEPDLEKI